MSSTTGDVVGPIVDQTSVSTPVTKPGKLNSIPVVAANCQSDKIWYGIALVVGALSAVLLGISAAGLIGTHTHLPVSQWVITFAEKAGHYLPLITTLSGIAFLFSLVCGYQKRCELASDSSEVKALEEEAGKIALARYDSGARPLTDQQIKSLPVGGFIWGQQSAESDKYYMIQKTTKGNIYLKDLTEKEKDLVKELWTRQGLVNAPVGDSDFPTSLAEDLPE